MTRKMVDYSSWDSLYRSNEKHKEEYSPDIADILRILKAEIKSCKEDNDMIIQSQDRLARAQEKQVEFDAVIL